MSEQRARPAPRHHESTAATETTCPCGAPILSALVEGVRVHVEPAAVPNSATEIALRLSGRSTYDQFRCGELAYRDAHRILNREYPVLVQHTCIRGAK